MSNRNLLINLIESENSKNKKYYDFLKENLDSRFYHYGFHFKKFVNYCPMDNFRMISLNEGHDYKKTGNTLGNNKDIIEWEKVINS